MQTRAEHCPDCSARHHVVGERGFIFCPAHGASTTVCCLPSGPGSSRSSSASGCVGLARSPVRLALHGRPCEQGFFCFNDSALPTAELTRLDRIWGKLLEENDREARWVLMKSGHAKRPPSHFVLNQNLYDFNNSVQKRFLAGKRVQGAQLPTRPDRFAARHQRGGCGDSDGRRPCAEPHLAGDRKTNTARAARSGTAQVSWARQMASARHRPRPSVVPTCSLSSSVGSHLDRRGGRRCAIWPVSTIAYSRYLLPEHRLRCRFGRGWTHRLCRAQRAGASCLRLRSLVVVQVCTRSIWPWSPSEISGWSSHAAHRLMSVWNMLSCADEAGICAVLCALWSVRRPRRSWVIFPVSRLVGERLTRGWR